MSQGPVGVSQYFQVAGKATQGQGDAQGAALVGQAHGALYEPTYAGRVMMGANQAGATLSVGLATTYTGLCLSNPAGSGKNLIIQRVFGLLSVAPAALTPLGIITGYAAGGITAHTTPLAPINSKLNGAAPVGLLDAACTLVGTPVWSAWLGVGAGPTSNFGVNYLTDGSIVLPPGGYAAIGSLIAGPAAGFLGAFSWEEAPV